MNIFTLKFYLYFNFLIFINVYISIPYKSTASNKLPGYLNIY